MDAEAFYGDVFDKYARHLNPSLAKLMGFAGFGVEVWAEGCILRDHEGREFIDCLGGYGTFTFGHLGPAPLRGLLRIARPGALFIIGVNRAHFETEHFAQTLDDMTKQQEIGPVALEEIAIYAKPGHAHSDDRALVLQFRKL